MNTLQLRVDVSDEEYGAEVRVLIDGRDLIELARAVEVEFAAADGQPQLAGAYRGLDPVLWRELPEAYGDGRAAVLACECGQPGCWPLRVRITVARETVTWSDFEQPHRAAWQLEHLGPFVFPRASCEAAVTAVGIWSVARDV